MHQKTKEEPVDTWIGPALSDPSYSLPLLTFSGELGLVLAQDV